LTLAGLTVLAAISFALLAEPVLVQASLPQFAAHVSARGSLLTGFAVGATISFAAFAQPVLVFAGAPQFLALSATASATAIVDPHTSGANLYRLG
jgi:hypothetical protein